jgi:hypothetical protein
VARRGTVLLGSSVWDECLRASRTSPSTRIQWRRIRATMPAAMRWDQ